MKLPINMYDPTRDYINHKEIFDNRLGKIINEGIFINGPEVKELETNLQQFTNSKYAITCANGTDALFISLLALGIKSGDEVLTVSHTWISTSEAIVMTGALPVFVDITEEDFNIDINKIESKITNKTKVIIPVSLYGQMSDYKKIREIADKYNLSVIEDGAQSFGAELDGYKSCSCKYTDIATTSFFPSKPIGCWGDGGAMFTNNDELAIKLRSIKSHGGLERFKHEYIGMNSRLDTIQAGIVLEKMKRIYEILDKRRSCADYYTEGLKKIDIITPKVKNNSKHVWAQYSLLCKDKEQRDNIEKYLKDNKVNVSIFYPIGLHKQNCFKKLGIISEELDVTDRICDRIINLPCYAEITKEEQDYILSIINMFFTS
jgi:UDP-2-acetamido-2-deoxy-ribo-hexuluronate aminotransferase